MVQVGKTADFSTASQMAQQIERRLGEAFLLLNIRQSERTTAEEVRLTQLELEQQLGGLFSLLTVEFLEALPGSDHDGPAAQVNCQRFQRNLSDHRSLQVSMLWVRGQDRESLSNFMLTIAQTLGPEALMQVHRSV